MLTVDNVTVRFGELAAQVVPHSLDTVPTFDGLLGGDQFAAQVWPVSGPVRWPPGGTLTTEWFDIVCDLNNPPEQTAK